jgi:hypothetical protein
MTVHQNRVFESGFGRPEISPHLLFLDFQVALSGVGRATLGKMAENDWTRLLGWPGYKVYRHEVDEPGKRLKPRAKRRCGNRQLMCSGCS